MTSTEKFFAELADKFTGANEAAMFGWRCISYKRKPFIFLDKDTGNRLAFKLGKAEVLAALELRGTEVFNPGDKGKPMTNWVTVSQALKNKWTEFAELAYALIVKESKTKP
jgi:hypothetical protein